MVLYLVLQVYSQSLTRL
jgi:hypothetical protein